VYFEFKFCSITFILMVRKIASDVIFCEKRKIQSLFVSLTTQNTFHFRKMANPDNNVKSSFCSNRRSKLSKVLQFSLVKILSRKSPRNIKMVHGINSGLEKESISTYPTKLSKQPLSARWRAIWSTRAAIESNGGGEGGRFVDIKNSFRVVEANETRTDDRRWMVSVYFGFRLRQRADITTSSLDRWIERPTRYIRSFERTTRCCRWTDRLLITIEVLSHLYTRCLNSARPLHL